jgi:hypothetical protein
VAATGAIGASGRRAFPIAPNHVGSGRYAVSPTSMDAAALRAWEAALAQLRATTHPKHLVESLAEDVTHTEVQGAAEPSSHHFSLWRQTPRAAWDHCPEATSACPT